MCGIYLTNIKQSVEDVIRKINTIKFRGPDHTGVKQYGDVTMAHLRLPILDLDSRSNQPFEFDSLSIVFNGEIYNYGDLRDELKQLDYHFETTSDTEVLIKGFHHWGVDVVNRLNGMFAFAIFDTIKQKIFVCRDRLGVKPVYFYWKNGDFEICSQLRPISQGKTIKRFLFFSIVDTFHHPTQSSKMFTSYCRVIFWK